MASFLAVIIASLALSRLAVSQQTVNYCEALVDAISICEYETPSFTQLPVTAQQNCLCGSELGTIPWGPATFDNIAASCAIEYATINTAIASDAAELAGLCSGYRGATQAPVASSTANYAATTVPAAAPQSSVTSFATNTNLVNGATATAGSGSGSTIVSVVTVAQVATTSVAGNAATNIQHLELGGLAQAITWGLSILVGYVFI